MISTPLLGSTFCMLAVEVLVVKLGTPHVRKFAVMFAIVVTVMTVSPPSMNNATRSIFLHVTVVDPMISDWMSAYLRYLRSSMSFIHPALSRANSSFVMRVSIFRCVSILTIFRGKYIN